MLREVSWGEWNGMTRADIAKRDPALWRQRELDKWTTRPPGGESYADVADRVGPWLEKHQGEHMLVVCHGTVTRVLRGLYLKLSSAETLTLEEPQGVYFHFSQGTITRHPDT